MAKSAAGSGRRSAAHKGAYTDFVAAKVVVVDGIVR